MEQTIAEVYGVRQAAAEQAAGEEEALQIAREVIAEDEARMATSSS